LTKLLKCLTQSTEVKSTNANQCAQTGRLHREFWAASCQIGTYNLGVSYVQGEVMSTQTHKGSFEYPRESRWNVTEGIHDNRSMYVRVNVSAAQLARDPRYRTRVGIAVPLKAPTPAGLPTTSESGQLDAVEDALCSSLEAAQTSLHVLTITTAGMREFVFYTRSASEAQAAITAVQEQIFSYVLQSYVDDDPQWEVYANFS
jgi:Family of unknown function (DUF695)